MPHMLDRLMDVAAGRAQFAGLDGEERGIVHAIVDARIAELAAAQSFGRAARADGATALSIDDADTLIEIEPDGTRKPL